MYTTQDNLNILTREYEGHKKDIAKISKEIEHYARLLLKELQQQKDWECMIKGCYEHYKMCPDVFFEHCSVTHTRTTVKFIYCEREGYEVLEISFKKSLKDQIRDTKEKVPTNRECIQISEERHQQLLKYESLALWMLNLIVASSLPNIELTEDAMKKLSNDDKCKAIQAAFHEALKNKEDKE